MEQLFIAQLISCAILTGLIWTIQCVHYPSFKYIPDNEFKNFHNFHSQRITWIVMPVMLVELTSAGFLVALKPDSVPLWLNLAGVVLIWLFTFFLSMPIHGQLSQARNSKTVERLIATNWYRTLLWSFRLILLIFVLETS